MPGEAGAVLFIQGLDRSGIHDYSEVATQPALAGYRHLLVVLPGNGFSDQPFEAPRAGEEALPAIRQD